MWPMKMTSSTTRTKSLILMRMMGLQLAEEKGDAADRKSTRLNSSHLVISYAVFCLKKKNQKRSHRRGLDERYAPEYREQPRAHPSSSGHHSQFKPDHSAHRILYEFAQ